MEKRLKIGDKAKNFSLEDQDEHEFTLSYFKGKRVLLSFHPFSLDYCLCRTDDVSRKQQEHL